MTQALSIEELAAELTRRGTPLSAETGMFVMLEAVEAMRARPVWLTPTGVRVAADGVVSIDPDLDEVSVVEAMSSVVDVLELVVAPLPSGIASLARRVHSGEVETTEVFASEIEALLVPLNRGAARRMLGRLTREHLRGLAPVAEPDAAVDEVDEESAVATTPDGRPKLSPRRLAPSASATDLTEGLDEQDGQPKGGRSLVAGIAAVLLAALAVIAAGMFLYHRLQTAPPSTSSLAPTSAHTRALASR